MDTKDASVNDQPQEIETQPKKKNNKLLIIVIVVGVIALLGCGCCGIIALMSSSSTTKNENETTQATSNNTTIASNTSTTETQKEEPTTSTTSIETTIDKLWGALDNTLKRNGYDVQFDSNTGEATLTEAPKTYLNDTEQVREAFSNFVKYGAWAFKIDEVKVLSFDLQGKFIDTYGKEVTSEEVGLSMSKEEYNKYDWNNLRESGISVYTRMQNSCTIIYIHPAIKDKVDYTKLYLE